MCYPVVMMYHEGYIRGGNSKSVHDVLSISSYDFARWYSDCDGTIKEPKGNIEGTMCLTEEELRD